MVKGMNNWLREYEQFRHNPYEPNEKWVSTKFDIEGLHWLELRELYVPDLDMNWGQACSALRKNWTKYKIEKREGLYGSTKDIAYRIKKIQRSLGIPESEFPELDEEWAGEQLNMEELQLIREEQEENVDIWSLKAEAEAEGEDPEEEEEEDDDEDAPWEGV